MVVQSFPVLVVAVRSLFAILVTSVLRALRSAAVMISPATLAVTVFHEVLINLIASLILLGCSMRKLVVPTAGATV